MRRFNQQLNMTNMLPHGITSKPLNFIISSNKKWDEINSSLHTFFGNLVTEAETHSTRVVREFTGIASGDDDDKVSFHHCTQVGFSSENSHLKGVMI